MPRPDDALDSINPRFAAKNVLKPNYSIPIQPLDACRTTSVRHKWYDLSRTSPQNIRQVESWRSTTKVSRCITAMFSIPHIIVIFVVALVVFGPEKLPELARNLGKVMGEFRRATTDLRSTFEGHLRDLEREADQRKIAGPTALPSLPTPPVDVSAKAMEEEIS